MSGMEPCGELVLETLWLPLRLERLSRLKLSRVGGDATPIRPRSTAFPLFRPGRDEALTRPNASFVIIRCSSCSLRSKASCSSAFLSASSSFLASSSSESEPSSSEDTEDVRLNGLCDFFASCRVRVEEDIAFFGRGELAPRELNRARTPRGVGPRPEDERRPLPVIRLTALLATVPLSTKGNSSRGLVGDCIEGVNTPGISCSPRSSSRNLVWTR